MICETMAMMGLSFMGAGGPPDIAGRKESDLYPVRCNYELVSSADKCDVVIEAAEIAWEAQVLQAGHQPPTLDDAGWVEIYLTDNLTGPWSAWTMCDRFQDAVTGDGMNSCPAYVSIHPEIPDQDMQTYVAHEFNHVLQFATDYSEPAYLIWEATASAWEGWTYPSLPSYVSYVQDFQADPWVGLMGDGMYVASVTGRWTFYEYGGAVWNMHMDNAYGDGTGWLGGAQLWAAAAQEGQPPGVENEPDIIDAYDAITGDWKVALLELSIQRARMGTDYNPDWAVFTQDIPSASTEISLEAQLDAADLPVTVTPQYMPFETGSVFIQVTGLAQGESIELTLQGDPEVSWGTFVTEALQSNFAMESSITWTGSGGDIYLGCANLGREDFDADPSNQFWGSFPGELEQYDVTLTVQRVELATDSADTGEGGTPQEPDTGALDSADGSKAGGCSCSSTGSRKHGWLLLPALLFLYRGRRGQGAPAHHGARS